MADENAGNKVSGFFYHLIAYSIFNYSEGSIFLFNNPYTFIPLSSLATLQHSLQKKIPNEATDLIEWLGRVDGRTATLAMVSRYGMEKQIDKKNIEKLISGATLTGLGKLSLKSLSDNHVVITCDNSPLAAEYLKKFGRTKQPADCYIMGALAGSDVPLFGKKGFAKETYCIAKGDKYCTYDIKEGNYVPASIVKKTLGKEPDVIMDLISKSFLKRLNKLSISFKSKNIRFGDGNFYFNEVRGISIPIFVLVLLNEILFNHKKVIRDKIFQELAESYLDELAKIKPRLDLKTTKQVDILLDYLSMFGLGRFKLLMGRSNILEVELATNNYSKEYGILFGPRGNERDYFLIKLLEGLFSRFTQHKKVSCSELTCIDKGAKSCIFKITFLD